MQYNGDSARPNLCSSAVRPCLPLQSQSLRPSALYGRALGPPGLLRTNQLQHQSPYLRPVTGPPLCAPHSGTAALLPDSQSQVPDTQLQSQYRDPGQFYSAESDSAASAEPVHSSGLAFQDSFQDGTAYDYNQFGIAPTLPETALSCSTSLGMAAGSRHTPTPCGKTATSQLQDDLVATNCKSFAKSATVWELSDPGSWERTF